MKKHSRQRCEERKSMLFGRYEGWMLSSSHNAAGIDARRFYRFYEPAERIMKKPILLLSVLLLSSCVNAARNAEELHSAHEREMTVGIVQREIHRGMSQEEVAIALGSPNIVSKDDTGRETWIYDKIATEASYSNSRGGVGGLAGAAADVGSTLLLGLGSGSYSKDAGASAVTQRTLTVVVKFDGRGRVDTATYHASRF
jgi:hypothetical protein